MAKRKLNIPLALVAGVAAGVADPIQRVLNGNISGALRHLAMHYTGIDPETGSFKLDNLKIGLLPLVAGVLVHKFVGGSPLNVNKALANAGVPFIRI